MKTRDARTRQTLILSRRGRRPPTEVKSSMEVFPRKERSAWILSKEDMIRGTLLAPTAQQKRGEVSTREKGESMMLPTSKQSEISGSLDNVWHISSPRVPDVILYTHRERDASLPPSQPSNLETRGVILGGCLLLVIKACFRTTVNCYTAKHVSCVMTQFNQSEENYVNLYLVRPWLDGF